MTALKNATKLDLASIAQCHRSAFPHALSSAMGVKYLSKMLEWYLVDDRAFLFFIEENGICRGYCGGLTVEASSRPGSASSMIQHSFRAAIFTFLTRPWLFFHPEFIPKYRLIGRNLYLKIGRILGRMAKRKSAIVSKSEKEAYVGLIVIGVDPEFQGRGYGSFLLKEFEVRAKRSGYRKLGLTVKSDNKKAIGAYQRNGWKVTAVNKDSTSMEKFLNDM